MSPVPRHWQVLILAALGIGATLVAVPRALSGIVAVPQGGTDPGISRTAGATQTAKANTATMPGWSPSPSTSSSAADTKPPSLVTNLRISSNTDAVAVVSWDASNDNVAVRGYVVRADGVTSETSAPTVTFSWARRTGSITVQVAAVDSSGNQSEWRSIVVNPPRGTTTTQAAVTTAPAVVTTEPTTAAPTVTTTESTTPPPPPPPSSEVPLDSTTPTQAAVPVDVNPPAMVQPSSQPS
jgi:hypothetical protein